MKTKITLKLVAVLGWLIIASLLAVFALKHQSEFKIETNILKLLPATESDPTLDYAFDKFANKNMQQVIFLVKNNDRALAKSAAHELVDLLSTSELVDSVLSKFDLEAQKDIGAMLYQFRHQLTSEEDRKLLQAGNFEEFSEQTIEIIYSPISAGVAGLVSEDPFLLSYRFAQSLRDGSNLQSEDELLLIEKDEAHFVFISASLTGSPFERDTQQTLLMDISQVESRWHEQKNQSKLLRTGALFFAAEAYKTAKSEISTIGILSLVLVVGLVVFSFRSLLPLTLISVALVFGIASGLVVVLLIFNEIHLITLVFGASLVGVAVDYAFHYFVVDNSIQGQPRVKLIFSAITLGLISSIVGYLSLLTTPFPGLQQMAIFCITGLSAAYLTVLLLFPIFKLTREPSKTLLNQCKKVLNRVENISTLKVWHVLWLLPIIATFSFLQQPVAQDDIRQFQTTTQDLKRQESEIKQVLNLEASNQFFLVKGKSEQQLLRNLEQAQQPLKELIKNNVINGALNLTERLPSFEQQSQNYQLIKSLYHSNAIESIFELGVLSQVDYQKVLELFEKDSQILLSPDVWFASSMAKIFQNLWLGKIGDSYVAIIPIQGINDLNALDDISESVSFVDKVSTITDIFTEYRKQTTRLLIIALALITLILTVRYRLVRALQIVSAPIFSISITVLLLPLFGVNLTLFNTLALFLIIGIGIDYGLFFAESSRLCERTFMAIFLSALTTVFSFGLLSLSETVAIHSFGLTMLIGISSSFLLSPIIGSLVIRQKD